MSAPHDAHGRPMIPSSDALKRLPPDGGPSWNRLVFEKSPYLLQHAANPVDWFPWGDEAFETARRLDKPVFLSVGYSTCHWCHVMERESFEDAEVAALMNEAFVCVKVDREERPDIDHVYMTVTQALTGSGGWPMTVILTPDKKPFFAGTYFPKSGRHGRPGMLELVPRLAEAWHSHREHVVEEARRITEAVADMQDAPAAGAGANEPGEATMAEAAKQLEARFDPRHGGFGRAPKFPTPHQLSFLLRWERRAKDEHARAMTEKTLAEMRAGGVFDQAGLGLHRYSTDERWLVPHFEKMLYDQALLALAATEYHEAHPEDGRGGIARDVLAYVQRDMTSPGGGFYSAEDADSEGEEGRFYVWTLAEMSEVLGKDDAAFAAKAWGAHADGNFRDEATGTMTGANILNLQGEIAGLAEAAGLEEEAFVRRLESARERLFAAREKRVHPLKDDKILTDWNGLMIAAFAKAARAFGDASYEITARRAADDVLAHLVTDEGRCLKRMRLGEAGLPGMLEDHAFLAWGLFELYETTFDARYLQASLRITRAMIAHFSDEKAGGFFLSPDDGEPLPVRGKDAYDGALPSGNSVAAYVLTALARVTGDSALEDRATGVFRAFASGMERGASAHCFMLMALDLSMGPSREVVIVGDPSSEDTRALLAVVRSGYRPNVVVLLRPPGDAPLIASLAPFTAQMKQVAGKATAYVCTGNTCKAPVTSAEALAAEL